MNKNEHNIEAVQTGTLISSDATTETLTPEPQAGGIASAEAKKPAKAERPKKPAKPKKPKKPWTKKRIITWAVVGVVVALLGYSCVAAPVIAANAARREVSMSLGTTLLSPQEIVTSISATGTVESADKQYVYPIKAGYSVREVPVEVGDVVQEGDILCLLDDSTLQDQIDTNELSLTQGEKAANQQVKTARDSYNALQDSIEDGTNTTLINAQGAVTSAYNAYLSAMDSYNQYSSKLQSAETTLANAQAAANQATTAKNTAKTELDAAIGTPDEAAKQAAYDQAVQNETDALAALATAKATRDSISSQGSSLSLAVSSAQNSYQTALRNMDAAIASVETQLESSKNQLSSTKISAATASKTKDLTMEQLEAALDDTIVRAPAAGTITAVYATVGGSGSGLLFVIEDVNNLIVKSTVKAFDVGTVKEGLPVTIKSDATGDAVYDGSITFIAPATQKTPAGETNTTSEVFDAEVAVSSRDTGLHIGMSVRLNYIVEKQEGVLAVPYDSVYTNDAGQDCVMAAVEGEKGKYVLTEIPVTLGIESDLDVAVSGEGIEAGLRILNEPEGRTPGEVITLV
ncbi:MAG: HlyD family efflux transporter periplasmic adaptor subunit [Candidatus Pelethousia sp.]|nr:HlyD family efflux transporter periplasmic adaptor subunit [Candidatus Pelethousia sp.]